MPARPRSAFWTFSITIYARPGVAPACLDLQARHGLDVNLLLYAIWIGISGRGRLSRRALDHALELSVAWSTQVVRPLRQVRTRLKHERPVGMPVSRVEALRQAVKTAELDAEHLEQLALAALAPARRTGRNFPPPRRRADAGANALAVLGRYADSPASDDHEALEILFDAAYIKKTQAVGKSRRRA